MRAGAARRSTNASLMPRRTNCKPTTQQDEREGEAGWEETETGGGEERREVDRREAKKDVKVEGRIRE